MAINATLLTKDNVPINPPTTMDQVTGLVDKLATLVEKVEGKGLSTNDFTTILMNKLNTLENYDDAALRLSIDSLNNQLDTLVNGNASAAIDSYNQIVEFLKNIDDTTTLEGLIAGINAAILAEKNRAIAAENAIKDSLIPQSFSDVVFTNPSSKGIVPRRIGDSSVNSETFEVWESVALANDPSSWVRKSAGKYGGTLITDFNDPNLSGVNTALNTAANAPNNTENWYCLHMNSNAGTASAVQIAIGFTTGKIYQRLKINSAYGNWIGGVTATEFSYLTGIISPIQSQLNDIKENFYIKKDLQFTEETGYYYQFGVIVNDPIYEIKKYEILDFKEKIAVSKSSNWQYTDIYDILDESGNVLSHVIDTSLSSSYTATIDITQYPSAKYIVFSYPVNSTRVAPEIVVTQKNKVDLMYIQSLILLNTLSISNSESNINQNKNSIKELEDRVTSIETLPTLTNILSYIEGSRYYYQLGVIVNDPIYFNRKYEIPEACNKLKIEINPKYQYTDIYDILDESGNVLSHIIDTSTNSFEGELDITQYPSAKYIVLSNLNANKTEEMIMSVSDISQINTTYLTSRLNNSDEEISNIQKKNQWDNKKIAWYGTSIPAGVGGIGLTSSSAYPQLVAELLNAKVYNEAIGESTAKGFIISNAGLNGKTISNLINKGLGNTIAEKMQIVNDIWTVDYVNKTISQGPGSFGIIYPSSSDYTTVISYIRGIIQGSFEYKIIGKYLDTSNTFVKNALGNVIYNAINDGTFGFVENIDLFVLDHGHNDAVIAVDETNNTITDTSNHSATSLNSMDRTTFVGAMNSIINTIYMYNPKARITILSDYTDYYNGGSVKLFTCDALKMIAKWWNIPFCDLRYMLPFSYKKRTIKGYWGSDNSWHDSGFSWVENTQNNTYTTNAVFPQNQQYYNSVVGFVYTLSLTDMKSYINPRQINGTWYYDYPQLFIYIRDALHPHTDGSNKALTMYAQTISSFFKTISI